MNLVWMGPIIDKRFPSGLSAPDGLKRTEENSVALLAGRCSSSSLIKVALFGHSISSGQCIAGIATADQP